MPTGMEWLLDLFTFPVFKTVLKTMTKKKSVGMGALDRESLGTLHLLREY